jgi:hypothetical protein
MNFLKHNMEYCGIMLKMTFAQKKKQSPYTVLIWENSLKKPLYLVVAKILSTDEK